VNTAGTTRLGSVEAIGPPTAAIAIGKRTLGSAPQPKTSGIMQTSEFRMRGLRLARCDKLFVARGSQAARPRSSKKAKRRVLVSDSNRPKTAIQVFAGTNRSRPKAVCHIAIWICHLLSFS
jgi:hypothetical protein